MTYTVVSQSVTCLHRILPALLCASVCAFGAIIPLSQIRTISAAGSVTSQGGSAYDGGDNSAFGFGLFDDAVGFAVSYTDPVFPAGGGANGIAQQRSEISSSIITANLIADASAGAYDYSFADTTASGSSMVIFQVTFDIDSAQTYRFSSSGFIFDTGEAYMSLSSGAEILAENWGYTAPDIYLDLTPGRYVLDSMITAYASASADEFRAGRTEMAFMLEEQASPVPEPGSALLLGAGLAALALIARRQPSSAASKD